MATLEYLHPATFCTDSYSHKQQTTSPTSVSTSPSESPKPNTGHMRSSPAISCRRERQGIARFIKDGVSLVNSTVQGLLDGFTEEQRAAMAKKEEKKQILHLRLQNAKILEHWRAAAKELDILEDNESWKFDNGSSDFDAPLIEARLRQLDDARGSCDVNLMLSLVRTTLVRDLGGMGNAQLYNHSYVGTKDLIERYIDSTLATIRALVEMTRFTLPEGMDMANVLEQVVYARQAFGRSALLLSGGGTFGMNHIGVLKALYEQKLLPRIISGASAGSIVCAGLCTRTDEEIPIMLATFAYGDLAVFEREGREDRFLERVERLLTQGSWIDNSHLIRVMQEVIGDMTFQEAYNRTRRILNICVSSASVYELPRLLNYVTSPNVMIWSAVAASCSVPLLFSAASLLVKNPVTGEYAPWDSAPQQWIDGSVDNDLPMTRLAEMFNVNHFIVSQVNPHVVPFLAQEDKHSSKQLREVLVPSWVCTLSNLAKDEALHRMHVLAEVGVFPNLISKARSVLSQRYSGDITILPQIIFRDLPLILKNPTASFMEKALLCGERATWPKLSRVKNHCAIELELDSAVQKLRARVVFSNSQSELRRLTSINYQSIPGPGRVSRLRGLTQMNYEDSNATNRSNRNRTRTYLPGLTSPTRISGNISPGRSSIPSDSPLVRPASARSLNYGRHFFPRSQLYFGDENVEGGVEFSSSAADTSGSLDPGTEDEIGDADVESCSEDSGEEAEAEKAWGAAMAAKMDSTDMAPVPTTEILDIFSSAKPATAIIEHAYCPPLSPVLTRMVLPNTSQKRSSSSNIHAITPPTVSFTDSTCAKRNSSFVLKKPPVSGKDGAQASGNPKIRNLN